MNAKFMKLLCALPMAVTLGTTNSFSSSIYTQPTEKISSQISQALIQFDLNRVKVIGVLESDGKTQLTGITQIAKVFEDKLAQKFMQVEVKLSDFFDGFIGMSSGAIAATAFALGGKADQILQTVNPLKSQTIIPGSAYGCLGLCKAVTNIASAYVTAPSDYSSDAEKEKADAQNQYDAFLTKKTPVAVAISGITNGESSDLKTGLNILTLNKSTNYADQCLSAIDEKDAVSKKNLGKMTFDAVLKAAVTATNIATEIGGANINQAAAKQALDILKKTEKTADAISKGLDEKVFKQSPSTWLTDDTPIVIIDFNADTSVGKAITTNLSIDSKKDQLKINYTTAIPTSMYPGKKSEPFDAVVSKNIEQTIESCFGKGEKDSVKSTDALIDFLVNLHLSKIKKVNEAKEVVVAPVIEK